MAIPFILGGITLASVGYGLYKYFEEDECTQTSYEPEDTLEERLKKFYELEVSIYTETLPRFYDALDKIDPVLAEGLEFDVSKISQGRYRENQLELDSLHKLHTACYTSRNKEQLHTMIVSYINLLEIADESLRKGMENIVSVTELEESELKSKKEIKAYLKLATALKKMCEAPLVEGSCARLSPQILKRAEKLEKRLDQLDLLTKEKTKEETGVDIQNMSDVDILVQFGPILEAKVLKRKLGED